MYRFYSKSGELARVSVVGEFSEGELKIAVARCSKKDRFVKAVGRTIAEGRLKKGKTYATVKLDSLDIATFVQIAKEIANSVGKATELEKARFKRKIANLEQHVEKYLSLGKNSIQCEVVQQLSSKTENKEEVITQ